MAHTDLYIVDNSTEDTTVKKYLTDWCSVSKQMDIATGYLEIGGLLALDTHWQKLDKIRIILGNEMTKRTKDVIDEVASSMLRTFRQSVDQEHEHNEFLIGVPAILDALKNGKIECCFDGEYNLIKNEVIDGASEDINKIFDQLIELTNGDS